MADNDNITMSRIAFERMQAKDERNDKWRNIIIILLIILLRSPDEEYNIHGRSQII